jgi:hypothetical protein
MVNSWAYVRSPAGGPFSADDRSVWPGHRGTACHHEVLLPVWRDPEATCGANTLRADMHAYRPLAADCGLAQAIAVLACAQQDAVWDRATARNKLCSHLRE